MRASRSLCRGHSSRPKSDCFDFHEEVHAGKPSFDGRASGEVRLEERAVFLVHLPEVVHVSQEDSRLEDVCTPTARFLWFRLDVFKDRTCLTTDVVRDWRSGAGVETDLARYEDEGFGDNGPGDRQTSFTRRVDPLNHGSPACEADKESNEELRRFRHPGELLVALIDDVLVGRVHPPTVAHSSGCDWGSQEIGEPVERRA